MSGWAVDVSQYMPEIQYIPGKDQVVADFFTRVRVEECGGGGDESPKAPPATLGPDLTSEHIAASVTAGLLHTTEEGSFRPPVPSGSPRIDTKMVPSVEEATQVAKASIDR